MEQLFIRYLQNGLRDFSGLEITGHIPLTQELINELVSTFLQAGTNLEPSQSPLSSNINLKDLLTSIKRAHVSAETGRVILDFEFRVP